MVMRKILNKKKFIFYVLYLRQFWCLFFTFLWSLSFHHFKLPGSSPPKEIKVNKIKNCWLWWLVQDINVVERWSVTKTHEKIDVSHLSILLNFVSPEVNCNICSSSIKIFLIVLFWPSLSFYLFSCLSPSYSQAFAKLCSLPCWATRSHRWCQSRNLKIILAFPLLIYTPRCFSHLLKLLIYPLIFSLIAVGSAHTLQPLT